MNSGVLLFQCHNGSLAKELLAKRGRGSMLSAQESLVMMASAMVMVVVVMMVMMVVAIGMVV